MRTIGVISPERLLRQAYLNVWFRMSLLAGLFALVGLFLLKRDALSLLVFLMFGGLFASAWAVDKATGILSVLLFLFLLGDIRRVINMTIGFPQLDPLLLLGTLFATCLALPLIVRVRLTDPLTKCVLALTVIMSLEVLNPRQGSITIGLSGALFYLTPLFWFWIGRTYTTEALMHSLFYKFAIPLGSIAALLGIYQTFIGFLPWEDAWGKAMAKAGYSALYLGGGHIRSFGFSSNSAEYGNLLMITGVCLVGAAFAGRRAFILLLPVLLISQLLASMRGQILKLLVAVVVMWAVRGTDKRTWIRRIVLGLPVGAALLYFSVSQVSGSAAPESNNSAANLATNHVTQGLAHPLDARYSTAGLHSQMFWDGIVSAFRYPIGSGLGVVTLGAGKFGGRDPGVPGSSEIDISDVFITTGFIGGLIYIFTVGVAIKLALEYIQAGPRTLSFTLLGILISLLSAWIPLGQYALGPFLWFCLGFLAQQAARQRTGQSILAMPAQGTSRLQFRPHPGL